MLMGLVDIYDDGVFDPTDRNVLFDAEGKCQETRSGD